jgi:hypothetical protein
MTRLHSFRLRRMLCALAALFAVVGAAEPARAQFETRTIEQIRPYGASSVAMGDFNHDGKLDLVVSDDNGFTVSLGNGDGTFQAPTFYSTQVSYSLAVADFNGDGNLDIVVANDSSNPSTVSVYLGNGDGTFQPPINSNTTSFNTFVVVGDFNGDGKPDIAVIDHPYISVLLGNGDGTFGTPSDNNSLTDPAWLAVGDFNNDHKLDVIAVGSFGASYSMGVLLGNGNGALQDSLTYPLQYVPASVAAGDLRNNGDVDAIVGYDLDGVAVLLGNGDGSFQPAVNYDTTGIGNGVVVVGDLNLDGRLDVAVPSGPAPGVDVFWGEGSGTLQPAQFFASSVSGLPAVGDLNGDHKPDFAFVNEFGVVTMLNTGGVGFSPTSPLVFPIQALNTTSTPQTVTLTNNGTTTLLIASIKVSGEFQMSHTCGNSLAVGASCGVSVIFEPKTAGTHTGTVTISDSASSKPQFIDFSGRGTVLALSPGSLRFGAGKVGTKSAPQIVTATNNGNAAISLSSVGMGGTDKGDFSETNNCTAHAIEPGGSCEASVTFDPTKKGPRSAALYFNLPTGSLSPLPVALTGTGK